MIIRAEGVGDGPRPGHDRGPPPDGFAAVTATVTEVTEAWVRSPATVTGHGCRGDGHTGFATAVDVLVAGTCSPGRCTGPARTTYLVTGPPDVFPRAAIPGILGERGASRPALSVPGTPMSMALAVRLARVTVSTARERGVAARAEVAG